ncbi:MAG: N-carbamoylputrescine amidase [Deltaproteobacteria bacterium]|nr:N-carbamoylputrescine amidase [Deltaproteobacteria bacterium]
MSEVSRAPARVSVGVLQAALGGEREANVRRIESLVHEAAARGAHVALPPELFEGPYFPKVESEEFFEWARPAAGNATIARFQALAAQLGVVVPVSFFEKDGPHYYNSVAMIDAGGALLGIYRKSHIPDGPGYEEKFYFRPGDTGFRTWQTRAGAIGVGICWDQWFPECARAMMLAGAELLLYPTAIGSEPHDPDLDTSGPWRRAMVGHAVSNVVPVAAANRVGDENGQRFYGHSFVCDHRGEVIAELGDQEEGVALASFDPAAVARTRAAYGFFRDRRPDLYGALTGE